MTSILFAISAAFAFVVTVFFARFWRSTKDRFFALFAIAFALLTIHWLVLATPLVAEHTVYHYLLRLLAFMLILVAVIDKNRG